MNYLGSCLSLHHLSQFISFFLFIIYPSVSHSFLSFVLVFLLLSYTFVDIFINVDTFSFREKVIKTTFMLPMQKKWKPFLHMYQSICLRVHIHTTIVPIFKIYRHMIYLSLFHLRRHLTTQTWFFFIDFCTKFHEILSITFWITCWEKNEHKCWNIASFQMCCFQSWKQKTFQKYPIKKKQFSQP